MENKHTLYLIINEFDFGFSVLIIWHSGKINKEKIHYITILYYTVECIITKVSGGAT